MTTNFVIDLRRATTLDELAVALGVAPELLRTVTSSETRQEFYTRHEIPKRNRHRSGQCRIVWEVENSTLADAHKAFNRRLNLFARDVDRHFPHDSVHGYVGKRSIRSNAQVHCGARLLLKADLADFFNTITKDRLVALFLDLGIQRPVAELMSRFATIDNRLPLGLHASPLLANLCCRQLDEMLKALAVSNGCNYTRYADDLAFSGKRTLPSRIDLSSEVEALGFKISPSKYRETKRGQAHFVTGLSITDTNGPHVPKKFKRRLMQELYYIEKYGLKDHLGRTGYPSYQKGINQIDGRVRYVSSIEPRLSSQLHTRWNSILSHEKVVPSYAPQFGRKPRTITFYIDEAEIDTPDGKVLAIACAVTEEEGAVADVTRLVHRRHQADPFYPGRKGKLDSKGLHFTDLHPSARADYIEELSRLPIRAYVAYDFLHSHADYPSTYVYLLRELLPHRFIACDRADIHIVYEENPKIVTNSIKKCVSDIYDELEKKHSRRPAHMPAVGTGNKRDHVCLSVPDFLLGVLADYAKGPPNKPSGKVDGDLPPSSVADARPSDTAGQDRMHFERLRDKYRLIVASPSNQVFSRRQPFSPWQDGRPRTISLKVPSSGSAS